MDVVVLGEEVAGIVGRSLGRGVPFQQLIVQLAHPGLVEIVMIDLAELAHQAEQSGQVRKRGEPG